jgi:hypothetical protein
MCLLYATEMGTSPLDGFDDEYVGGGMEEPLFAGECHHAYN